MTTPNPCKYCNRLPTVLEDDDPIHAHERFSIECPRRCGGALSKATSEEAVGLWNHFNPLNVEPGSMRR